MKHVGNIQDKWVGIAPPCKQKFDWLCIATCGLKLPSIFTIVVPSSKESLRSISLANLANRRLITTDVVLWIKDCPLLVHNLFRNLMKLWYCWSHCTSRDNITQDLIWGQNKSWKRCCDAQVTYCCQFSWLTVAFVFRDNNSTKRKQPGKSETIVNLVSSDDEEEVTSAKKQKTAATRTLVPQASSIRNHTETEDQVIFKQCRLKIQWHRKWRSCLHIHFSKGACMAIRLPTHAKKRLSNSLKRENCLFLVIPVLAKV